jgi:hypothetical protein
MKKEWLQMLREMRSEGYAVIVWTPEELGETDPGWVEDCSISYGSEYLIPETQEGTRHNSNPIRDCPGPSRAAIQGQN